MPLFPNIDENLQVIDKKPPFSTWPAKTWHVKTRTSGQYFWNKKNCPTATMTKWSLMEGSRQQSFYCSLVLIGQHKVYVKQCEVQKNELLIITW